MSTTSCGVLDLERSYAVSSIEVYELEDEICYASRFLYDKCEISPEISHLPEKLLDVAILLHPN